MTGELSILPDWLVVIVLSPFVGGFLGVLIRRIPSGEPLVMVRSACESCHRPVAVRDLVPVMSYLFLHGRCRHCHARISPFHLAIELAALIVALSAVLAGTDGSLLLAGCVLGWALLVLAWIDWHHLVLPDSLTLPLVPLGLAVTWLHDPAATTAHAIGALAGYVAFAGIAMAYRVVRGREGLGMGDAKLLAVGGAWLGWQALPAIVLLAALSGIGVVAVLRGTGRTIGMATVVPFGPCLALAIWIVWLSAGYAAPSSGL